MSYLEDHYNEIFKKYEPSELLKDIYNYQNGKGRLSKVLNHFFEEEMYKCIGSKYPMAPMEALANDEIVQYILDYTREKTKFYTGDDIANIKSYLRNGTRYARKVANFCPKNARDIYWRYFNEGEKINCLDMSMGFGSRMSAVLLTGGNYCGFDPNKSLFEKLKEYRRFLKDNHILQDEQRCGLYCQGSEKHRPELDNTFDVSFTSPPYFNLEVYGRDNFASSTTLDNYELWLEEFVKPTIDNTYRYLKVGGYAMINIKNLNSKGKQPLFDDWFKIFKAHKGFELVEVFEMYHQAKRNFTNDESRCPVESYTGFKEPVMVFRKVE